MAVDATEMLDTLVTADVTRGARMVGDAEGSLFFVRPRAAWNLFMVDRSVSYGSRDSTRRLRGAEFRSSFEVGTGLTAVRKGKASYAINTRSHRKKRIHSTPSTVTVVTRRLTHRRIDAHQAVHPTEASRACLTA
jgi:hypothetical protein